ncbi:MAG: hypothetical protein V1798_08400 [Pseudomonadota bacterium]
MSQELVFKTILETLDQLIEVENQLRRKESGFGFPKARITLVGQYGLLTHPDRPLKRLSLVATLDVDAWIDASEFVKTEFKRLLADAGLEYDNDSEKVWIPKESTFTPIFSTLRLECEVLDPVYSLVSKAIKAKEKNRILVRDALSVYGNELRDLINKHGGDCDYFEKRAS